MTDYKAEKAELLAKLGEVLGELADLKKEAWYYEYRGRKNAASEEYAQYLDRRAKLYSMEREIRSNLSILTKREIEEELKAQQSNANLPAKTKEEPSAVVFGFFDNSVDFGEGEE